MSLLLRLRELDGGAIRIDGTDIRDVTQASLRGQIGVVTQDVALFHRSVRDNIRYGAPFATDLDIERAVAKAEAADFIVGLRDKEGRTGLDAHVGERGVKLSGGQRQRLTIARVILKDAPILLLDEATSALDSEAEAAIQQNLERLMEGRTTLAIAHRLSTIAAMDRLVVMDRGRIVESGTHDELIARGELYARLWERQSGDFIAALDDRGEGRRRVTRRTVRGSPARARARGASGNVVGPPGAGGPERGCPASARRILRLPRYRVGPGSRSGLLTSSACPAHRYHEERKRGFGQQSTSRHPLGRQPKTA